MVLRVKWMRGDGGRGRDGAREPPTCHRMKASRPRRRRTDGAGSTAARPAWSPKPVSGTPTPPGRTETRLDGGEDLRGKESLQVRTHGRILEILVAQVGSRLRETVGEEVRARGTGTGGSRATRARMI